MIKELNLDKFECHQVRDGYYFKDVPLPTSDNMILLIDKINELVREVNAVDAGRKTATEIQESVNTLLRGEIPPEVKKDAVNWASVNCYDVQALANGGFIIKIDEADPSAYRLKTWIAKELKEYNIEEIINEW